ncbi:MAG: type II toxin-antitoxin system RelE/ParE family toxin [Bacteroidota bacterium]|nr:type II toxin-antitoxin system RelE/ParE family toxin [Bacteroidota bacterium]
MKVRWTRPAIRQLAEIKEYISESNPENAKRFIRSLYLSVSARLSVFPHLGRKVRELNDPKYRELVYRKYKIIYTLTNDEVVVLTIRSTFRESMF